MLGPSIKAWIHIMTKGTVRQGHAQGTTCHLCDVIRRAANLASVLKRWIIQIFARSLKDSAMGPRTEDSAEEGYPRQLIILEHSKNQDMWGSREGVPKNQGNFCALRPC